MNKKMRMLAALLCGAAVSCVPMVVQAQSKQLSDGLSMLYDVAQKHNATLQSCRSAVREAAAAIETARMNKLPDVSGQVSISYLGNARLWNRHFGESQSAPMPHFGNNFLLRAEQVLYTGGAIKSSIELAQQNAQMQQIQAMSEEQRVRFALTGLYLQLHSLYNRQLVYETNIKLAQEQIELMKKRREQGVSLRNDITRYELQLQQIMLGHTAVVDQQNILLRQLHTALGTDSVNLSILSEEAFNENFIKEGVENDWHQQASQSHFGLRQSSLAAEMSRTKERLVRADRLPKVAVIAEDHLDGPITIEVPPINKNLNYWYVGVGISYNFSSLYKAKRKMNQSRLATTFADEKLIEARQGVGDAIHAAYINLQTARTELTSHQKSVQLAEENYDVVSRRYKNGLALITDLTDAANMRLDAELSLANARINLAYCYYNLKYVANVL